MTGLIELGCTHKAFGRCVQPAATNIRITLRIDGPAVSAGPIVLVISYAVWGIARLKRR